MAWTPILERKMSLLFYDSSSFPPFSHTERYIYIFLGDSYTLWRWLSLRLGELTWLKSLTTMWLQAASKTIDNRIAFDGNMGQRHQQGPRPQQYYRQQHDPWLQHGPWTSTWYPETAQVVDVTLTFRGSTGIQMNLGHPHDQRQYCTGGHGLFCHRGPRWCPWLTPKPRVVLMSIVL